MALMAAGTQKQLSLAPLSSTLALLCPRHSSKQQLLSGEPSMVTIQEMGTVAPPPEGRC